MEEQFLKECKEARDDFAKIARQYNVGDHLELRTEIDSLLIMYDQLCERVRVANTKLIAAAPDMLEALQNLENDDNSIPERAWKMVKDAIAKAICEYNETENEERENNI